jgi:hypothetical protein
LRRVPSESVIGMVGGGEGSSAWSVSKWYATARFSTKHALSSSVGIPSPPWASLMVLYQARRPVMRITLRALDWAAWYSSPNCATSWRMPCDSACQRSRKILQRCSIALRTLAATLGGAFPPTFCGDPVDQQPDGTYPKISWPLQPSLVGVSGVRQSQGAL